MEKIAPKNNCICQELIALSGTFASPEKQGLIIDKLWLLKPEFQRRLPEVLRIRICLTRYSEDERSLAIPIVIGSQSVFQKPVK